MRRELGGHCRRGCLQRMKARHRGAAQQVRLLGRLHCALRDRLERPRGAVDGVGQASRHVVEEVADLRRHQDHGGDDEDRNQRHDERVLDRVSTALVLHQG